MPPRKILQIWLGTHLLCSNFYPLCYAALLEILKCNPKQLHKYFTQKQKVKHTFGSLKKPDGLTTRINEESAEALASFFKSIYVHEELS